MSPAWRVVLALPADAHGRPTHRDALAAARAAFPGATVIGPERRWDTLLTQVAAASKLSGAHALVFAAWEGHVSRGVFEIARAAVNLEGGAHWFDGEALRTG